MKALLIIVVALLALAAPASAAERVQVFVFAEPDATLGGLVSAALVDSAGDLETIIKKTGIRQWKLANKREDATMLVRVTGRSIVNDEYRVQVHVTLPDGSKRDLVGTNTHQWKLCMVPVAAALRDLMKASGN